MAGIMTRAGMIAARLPLSVRLSSPPRSYLIVYQDQLTLASVKAVRVTSSICRLNSTYAKHIDTLDIRMGRDEFIAVLDHINAILRRAENIAVLSLIVDHLPAALQTRVYRGVFLPKLWSLSVSSSSQQALRLFLHTHRHTLRHLRLATSQRRSTMVSPPDLPLLGLNSIIGPTTSVAKILSHCDHGSNLAICLTRETRSLDIQHQHPIVFHQHFVTNLCIVLQPRDYRVLLSLAMHFPHLRCLKVIEKGAGRTHVWSNQQVWMQALRT
ncbi:hypothetical protein BD626DRAFT_572400 [Schizophyllum amplum]|uniref:Uncharacterized protein n=1 Tax=Schizophyllum amplum TaxID=97359 RepID=A0A550C4K0_9AGAR|nr:hypothetical protein BD626DRAFT_572400 [Auriculariopsis ampla]